MHNAKTTLAALLKNEDGLAAMEYGLVAALISIVAVVAMRLVGTNLNTIFGNIGTALTP